MDFRKLERLNLSPDFALTDEWADNDRDVYEHDSDLNETEERHPYLGEE
jgi:hypothetical protein